MANVDSFARDWDQRIDQTEAALERSIGEARRHRLIGFGFVALAPPLASAAAGAFVAGRLSTEAALTAVAVLVAVFGGALTSWAQAARYKRLALGEKAELIRTLEEVSIRDDANTILFMASRQARLRRMLEKR